MDDFALETQEEHSPIMLTVFIFKNKKTKPMTWKM